MRQVPTVYVEKVLLKTWVILIHPSYCRSLPIDYTPEEVGQNKKAIVVIDALVVATLRLR
jgi:hypothetical protein